MIAIVASVATPEIRAWLGFERKSLNEALNKPTEPDITADKNRTEISTSPSTSGYVTTPSSLKEPSTGISVTVDDRLLGVWRYTDIRKSGSAQMVTDYTIGFKNDGTYNTKTVWAGMGNSGEEPQEFGQYQIVTINESGGIVKLDGKEMEYHFSRGSVQLGSTIYEFIRK